MTTLVELTFREQPGAPEELVRYPVGTVAFLIERTDIDDEQVRLTILTNYKATRQAWEKWFRACAANSAETRDAQIKGKVPPVLAEGDHQGRLRALEREKVQAEPLVVELAGRYRYIAKRDLDLTGVET